MLGLQMEKDDYPFINVVNTLKKPLKDYNKNFFSQAENLENDSCPILTEPQIERYLNDINVTDDQLKQIIRVIDPEIQYEKILENGQEEGYIRIEKDEPKISSITLDLVKLKNLKEPLFFQNPLVWIQNLRYHWLIKYKKLITLSFHDVPKIPQKISNVTSKLINKYSSLSGRVKRVTGTNVAITSSYYVCKNCKSGTIVDRYWFEKLDRGKCGRCGSTHVAEKENSRRYETWQVIVIEDFADKDHESGTSNSTIECRIIKELDFNTILPGELIEVRGILRLELLQKAKSKMYFDVYNLVLQTDKKIKKATPKEITKFEALKNEENLWETLKDKIFPNLSGLDTLKDAALLQYLRASNATKRDTIHLLFAGDAGVGKSQILRNIHKNLGGLYATGSGCTIAGLTATSIKDSEGGWCLDAGAVVSANNSTLLLDEFDKMNTLVSNALLEPMEEQTVSINKAGMNVNLPARTNLLCASNPKLSQKFENNNPLSFRDQLGLSAPLLSRFDLIFIITEESQKNIQSEVLCKILYNKADKQDEDYLKYLKYCKYLKPTVPDSIKEKIILYYNKLKTEFPQCTFGPRNIESIIRLIEAKCKSRLSVEANFSDCEFIFELYRKCLLSQFENICSGLAIKNEYTCLIEYPELTNLRLSMKQIHYVDKIIKALKQKPLECGELLTQICIEEPLLTLTTYNKILKQLEVGGITYHPRPMFLGLSKYSNNYTKIR